MAPVNNCVGWVARRSMDTNELHHPEAHGHTLHLCLSDMRHTSSFHITTLQTCVHSQRLMQEKGWYP